MTFILLHSPLVGCGTWTAVAALLRARGHDVAVPDLVPAMLGEAPYYPRLAEVAAAAAADKAILIVHSGAGALVPAIAERAPIAGVIFVDALVPYPGQCWFDSAPRSLNARIRGLAREGKLPPWDRWWPKGAIRALLADDAMYETFVMDLHEMPLAYFEEIAPAAPLVPPSAYLQLSEACQADADRAAAKGWPVTRLKLHHLAMLTQAETVALEIEQLAARF